MRPVLSSLLVAVGCALSAAPGARADAVAPKSASAFRDSVGVVTHIVYYNTPYGQWPRVVDKLEELGVRHVREGVYANPRRQWREWNEAYYRAVELAADRGIRFVFGVGPPGNESGTLDQQLQVVAGRLRGAAEAIEAPNEFDHFVGGARWPSVLGRHVRALYRKAKANPALRRLPVVAPSFGTWDGPRRFGSRRASVDVGNVHPYTGGLSPQPAHVRAELARARTVAGPGPTWATEAGFHNALNAPGKHAPGEHAPVSEAAGGVYIQRMFLEHFASGVARTYAYELVDVWPDPGRRNPDHHFGLLRADFSPKPAFTALKNLLTLVGRDERRPRLRPLRLAVDGADGDLRRLVLRRADGSYVVALWRRASVWDRDRRRPVRVRERPLTLTLPDATRVARADPLVSATTRPLALRNGRARLRLAGRPLVLVVETGGSTRRDRR